jgi:hypothetical protein
MRRIFAIVFLPFVFAGGKNTRARMSELQAFAQRTPVPLTATPAPLPTAPPPHRVSAPVTHFAGEVSRGQRYEEAIAPGLVFRLEPFAGEDSAWEIEIAPDTEPSPAAVDCIGAIAVPTHGDLGLSIEPPGDGTAPAAALAKPRAFDFVSDAPNCKRAWNINNQLNYGYRLTEQEREKLDRELNANPFPLGHGELKVLDSRVSASSEKGKPVAIEWIKFEVDLRFPKRANLPSNRTSLGGSK